jgi:hypothetical protein
MPGKIFVSWNVVTTSDVVLVAREKAAPLSFVYYQFFAAPHTQRNTTITPVNPVMHIVQVYKTADGGATLGQLIGECEIDASIVSQAAFTAIQFVVDRGNTGAPSYDPPSNQAQYPNPDLNGLTRDDFTVFRSGFGALTWGMEIDVLPGGGFEYIDGQQFSAGEEYTILVNNLVSTNILSSGNAYPEDIVVVTASRALAAPDMNKLLEVNAGSNITLTLDIAGMPDRKTFGINTHNGTQRYVGLTLNSGQYILVNGVQKNTIWIGRGETVQFIKKGAYLRVVNDWQGYRLLGSRVKGDFTTQPWNGILAIGGWVLKTDYPRVWEHVNSLGGEAINIADDSGIVDLDRGIWHYGLNKIWIPDYGGYFERNYDPDSNVDVDNGTRLPGRIQGDMVGPHSHNYNIRKGNAYTGAPNNDIVGNGFNNLQIQTAQTLATGSGIGTETRPKNISAYTYIIG